MHEPLNHRIVVSRRGGPEVMQLVGEALPDPTAGQVRVKVETAGVSGFDIMLRSRSFPGFPRPPFTPGVDVVGIVDAVGSGVESVALGERVAALLGFGLGGYAEYVCFSAQDAVPVPPGLEPASAVCVVANYLTAHMAIEQSGATSGERVLVQGAAGGVGTALLELGKLSGLEMYGTASAHNHEFVSHLGATPIDYRSEGLVQRVRDLTGEGVDVVFDPVGGARQLWRSYRMLRKGGRLVWFGVAASKQHGARVIPLSLAARFGLAAIPDGKRVMSIPDIHKDNDRYRATLALLLDHLAAGKMEPAIAERLPLARAARAHELVERGGHRGKVVLMATPGDG